MMIESTMNDWILVRNIIEEEKTPESSWGYEDQGELLECEVNLGTQWEKALITKTGTHLTKKEHTFIQKNRVVAIFKP